MVEIIFFTIASLVILWLFWQLLRAKRFNRFKALINQELKEKVSAAIKQELNEQRSELFPNNEAHQQATIYYWTQYPVRIVQAALAKEIIDQQWLKKTGNVRHCQHLFFIQQQHKAQIVEKVESD